MGDSQVRISKRWKCDYNLNIQDVAHYCRCFGERSRSDQ